MSKARGKNKPSPDIKDVFPMTISVIKYCTSQCPIRKIDHSRYVKRKKIIIIDY